MNLDVPTISPDLNRQPRIAQTGAGGRLAAVQTSQRGSHGPIVEWLGIAAILVQLAVVALVMVRLDMLSSAFRRVYYLAAAGFVINHLLPLKFRRSFFALLCLGAMLLVMGGTPERSWDPLLAIQRTAPILAVSGILIGICILPIGFWKRAALLALAAGAVALCRAGVIGPAAIAIVWPVLAAMFMFRIMVYLYDVSTSKQRPSLADSVGYFFLFPNSCIALFPLVDFKTFCRSHYDSEPLVIYQRGTRWIIRGITQLILYRLIQQLLALQASDVRSGTDLIQYILTTTFVYLQVSGQFHLVVGLLLLFGFNLPETNRRYFLSASFTDYWRRVNIYWKDFILKVFYYPTYFRLKSRGLMFALVVSTLWSFFVTWALHLYQTWWLTGSAGFGAPDAIFWGSLAVLVLINSIWEMKRGRQRKLASGRYTPRSAIGLMLRTAGTFACISILWSLWSCGTLSDWFAAWEYADWHTLAWGAAALVAIMIATLFYEILPSAPDAAPGKLSRPRVSPSDIWIGLARGAAPLLVALVLVSPSVQHRFDTASLQPLFDVLDSGDSAGSVRGRGYYDALTKVDEGNNQLWETLMRKKAEYAYAGPDPIRPVNDFRFREFIPLVHVRAYGTDFQTNRWGMRDRDYDLAKPPATVRIALLGSSHVMGYGVAEDHIFKSLLEEQLNREATAGHFQILNFAVNGLSPLGEIPVMQSHVPQFSPDVVMLVGHINDFDWTNRDLPRSLRQHVPLDNPMLEQVLTDARVTARTPDAIAAQRLAPYEAKVVGWCYQQVAERCRSIKVLPIYVYLPLPAQLPDDPAKVAILLSAARDAGFTVIDLSHLYDGQDRESLMLSEGWRHTNEKAHAMIAQALNESLTHDPRIDLLSLARRAAVPTAAQQSIH